MMNRSERVGAVFAKALAAGVLMASAGLAQALPFPAFEGRDANGTVNNSCTVTGATKCVMIYDKTLNITILNNWAIGTGFWSATAAADSAQALAETAGIAETGLTGWRLPTGDGTGGYQTAGALNEYLSIWTDVGSNFDNLASEFDRVFNGGYWSESEPFLNSGAWFFDTGSGDQLTAGKNFQLFAVAVRSGGVVAAVPEPESLALVLVGLVAAGVARRRRPL